MKLLANVLRKSRPQSFANQIRALCAATSMAHVYERALDAQQHVSDFSSFKLLAYICV